MSNVSGSDLRLRVLNELASSMEVTSDNINVTSHEGRLTLSGFVPSELQRAAAESIAVSVCGADGITSYLSARSVDQLDEVNPREPMVPPAYYAAFALAWYDLRRRGKLRG